MPAQNDVTTRFKVDISELKAGITEANRQIRLANAEFKSASSGMDNWEHSVEGIQKKLTQLRTVLANQEKVLDSYEKQLELVKQEYGENSAQADNMRIKIANQQATVNKTKASISEYEKALEQVEREQKNVASSANKEDSALNKLKSTIDSQERELSQLKKEYANVVLEEGKNSESAQKLAKQIDNLSTELKDNKKQLNDAEKEADQFDKSLDELDKDSKGASDGFTIMKGALANLATMGIRMAIDGMRELGRAVKQAYIEYDEGYDNVIKATGATGETAKQLTDSYNKVAKSVVGDLSEIGSAVGEINTRFGFTGSELETAGVKFQKFAKITGTDATNAVRLVSRAMGDAGIESSQYGEVLDELALASQASGISIETLTEHLTKYGAPMRALGFDTKESIAIFSQWEKAGVNTEIAFSGMKKAISNWSKEGKDARVEFKKTLEDIRSTPDIASATTKAIEVFGAKAGPDLADAIKNGRFEYENFLNILEGSTGTVENTYSQTEDGFDKVKLAIQSAKVDAGNFVKEIASKYQPQITGAIQGILKGAEKLVTFIMEHGRQIVAVLGAIGTAIGVAFATNKVATLKKSIDTLAPTFTALATKIGLVTVAEEGATASTWALNTAWLASPITWVIAGVVALGAAIAAYAVHVQNEAKEEYGLNEAQQQTIENCSKLKSEYDSMNEARNKSNANINSEYAYLSQLKNEYNGLVDSNGQIKAGYEDRANFIINELANALGVEVSQIREQIDANGQLGSAIDAVIEKKKAEALLNANEEAYNQAIKERTNAFNEYIKAQETASEAGKKWTSIQDEYNEAVEGYNDRLKISQKSAEMWRLAHWDVISAGEEAKKAFEDASQGVNDAREAYVGYNSTIQNYEGLSSAIISGDADKVNQAMQNMTYNFKTAETADRQSLEQQVRDMQTNYENMQKAVNQGAPGVTQEMVNQSKNMVDSAQRELDRLPAQAGATGTQAGMDYANGLGNQSGYAYSQGSIVAGSAYDGTHSTGDFSGVGSSDGSDYASGVGSQSGNAYSQGQSVGSSAKSGVDDGSKGSYDSGSFFGEGFFNGIGSWLDKVFNQGKGLAIQGLLGLKKGGEEGSPWKTTIRSGGFFGQGFEIGIQNTIKDVVSTAQDLAISAYQAINSETSLFDDLGENAGLGFADGLKTSIKDAIGNYLPDEVVASLEQSRNGIASSMKSFRGEDGSTITQGSVVNNYNFVQNNTSPKALSRLELYRDTNSLLFDARARLSNV